MPVAKFFDGTCMSALPDFALLFFSFFSPFGSPPCVLALQAVTVGDVHASAARAKVMTSVSSFGRASCNEKASAAYSMVPPRPAPETKELHTQM